MDTLNTVRIGRRLVGPGQPIYVIAEAGVNHNGDFSTAQRLVDAAAQAGADAVKFQLFSADRLVAPNAPTCTYQSKHVPGAADQHALLRRLELPWERLGELKARAVARGLDFLATPFGIPEVQTLSALGVPAIKVASPDIIHVPLLIAAADSGLPLIVSTGASFLAEVEFAVNLLDEHGARDRLILMHCVSAYPTAPEAAQLRCIQTLGNRFGVPVGFSDHTPDATFSSMAVLAGATILEKHLTLDRGMEGPDHFFSLTPDDFACYVGAARSAADTLGDGRVICSPGEMEVRTLSRGGIVACCDITADAPLRAEQLAVRRPSVGIDPACWFDVVGRSAATDIPAGTPLTWELLRSSLPAAAAVSS